MMAEETLTKTATSPNLRIRSGAGFMAFSFTNAKLNNNSDMNKKLWGRI